MALADLALVQIYINANNTYKNVKNTVYFKNTLYPRHASLTYLFKYVKEVKHIRNLVI